MEQTGAAISARPASRAPIPGGLMNRTIAHARRALLAVIVAVAALAGVIAQAPQAAAEDGYRYWAYYQWDGSKWAYAQKAADGLTPADGTVEGWRFAQATSNAPRVPRAAGDFNQICADVQPAEGKKRVAVVIDQGTPEDAPSPADKPNGEVQGTCVLIESDATGAAVLDKVAPVRKEKLTCGIDGYPADGCGGAVQINSTPADATLPLTVQNPVGVSQDFVPGNGSPQATNQPTSATGPIVVGAVIVVALAGGALLLTRRNKKTQA
ncbi:SCO2322 family protein [Enemella evansiae]|uniref:SCO2322 family protein n=1 Tax=Enemella evansiae TaxID=2016499 RepID=UPI001E56027E|nr:SCO2322 family protein [Enemella evansiae]